MKSLYFIPLN